MGSPVVMDWAISYRPHTRVVAMDPTILFEVAKHVFRFAVVMVHLMNRPHRPHLPQSLTEKLAWGFMVSPLLKIHGCGMAITKTTKNHSIRSHRRWHLSHRRDLLLCVYGRYREISVMIHLGCFDRYGRSPRLLRRRGRPVPRNHRRDHRGDQDCRLHVLFRK